MAFKEMVSLMDLAWSMRSEIVPCLVGPPGIGKTSAVRQHAENVGAGKVVKITASRCIPSETVGMTMPDNKCRSMVIYNSAQLSSLEDGDILFFDELLEADQMVLRTLLTLIESREMADGTPLPDVQIVAATNDTISPAQLQSNIKQRFMFMEFNVDYYEVSEYIKSRFDVSIMPSVVRSFMSSHSDSKYNVPSPRSLSKLVGWFDSSSYDDTPRLEKIVSNMWNNVSLASEISKAVMEKRDRHDHDKMVRSVIDVVRQTHPTFSDDRFDNCTFGEMMQILTSLDDFDIISSKLRELKIEEVTGIAY